MCLLDHLRWILFISWRIKKLPVPASQKKIFSIELFLFSCIGWIKHTCGKCYGHCNTEIVTNYLFISQGDNQLILEIIIIFSPNLTNGTVCSSLYCRHSISINWPSFSRGVGSFITISSFQHVHEQHTGPPSLVIWYEWMKERKKPKALHTITHHLLHFWGVNSFNQNWLLSIKYLSVSTETIILHRPSSLPQLVVTLA